MNSGSAVAAATRPTAKRGSDHVQHHPGPQLAVPLQDFLLAQLRA
jgi:hypothetical protein